MVDVQNWGPQGEDVWAAWGTTTTTNHPWQSSNNSDANTVLQYHTPISYEVAGSCNTQAVITEYRMERVDIKSES